MIGNILSLLLTTTLTGNPASYPIEIGGTAGDLSCKRAEGAEPVSAEEVLLSVGGVLDNGDAAPGFDRLKFGDVEYDIGGAIRRDKVNAPDGKAALVLLRDGAEPLGCGEQHLFAAPADKRAAEETAPKGTSGAKVDTSLDALARTWWGTPSNLAKVKAEGVLDGVWKSEDAGSPRGIGRDKAVLLTHLPSGAPASAFPPSVREGALVQVAVIRPTNGDGALVSYRLEVESCASVQPFRFKGGAVEKSEKKAEKQGAGPATPAAGDFEVVPIGQWIRCGAGPLEYKLIPSKADGSGFDEKAATKTTLRVREVHHLAATATVGFDATQLPTFGLTATEDGTGQLVTEAEEYGGLRVLLGAQWMIGGVDYQDMRWYNYFANLFVAVDVAKPLDGATFGLALTPTGGISLALGLSLSKTQHLGNGMKVGDSFTGEGDVPVDTDWRNPGVGPFIGLTLDHHLYEAVVKRFK